MFCHDFPFPKNLLALASPVAKNLYNSVLASINLWSVAQTGGTRVGERLMDGSVVDGTSMTSTAGVRVVGAQLPLSMVSEGETVTVARVRGSQELRQHLAELGFVQGASVKVVSRVNGDVLVSVKGATFGIGRDMAMKIATC